MPTISMSEKFCTAERSTLRPMRPKPLIPILMVMGRVRPSGMMRNESRRNEIRLDQRQLQKVLRLVLPDDGLPQRAFHLETQAARQAQRGFVGGMNLRADAVELH